MHDNEELIAKIQEQTQQHAATQELLQEQLDNLDEKCKTALFQKVKIAREKEKVEVIFEAKTLEAASLQQINAGLAQDLAQSNAKLHDSTLEKGLLQRTNATLQGEIERNASTIQTFELRVRSISINDNQKQVEDAQRLQALKAALLHKDREIAQLYPRLFTP